MPPIDDRDGLTDLGDLLRAEPAPPRGGASAAGRRVGRIIGIVVGCTVGAALLAAGGYVAWALTAPVADPTMETTTPASQAGAPLPPTPETSSISAVSVSGGEQYLGADAANVWREAGIDERRSIASITKLITALVVLDAHPLEGDDPGPTLTFDEADHDLYDSYYVLGATVASMPEGSSMSLRDALATMLVPSASNYADAIATWAFGSTAGYTAAARDWLERNGLSSTTIREPTGIDAGNVSSPRDMLALGHIAAANPLIAEISARPSVTLPGGLVGYNTNGLLGQEGITGLKTGNLGRGDYTLLYTASVDVGLDAPLVVTGVTLGAVTREVVNTNVLTMLGSLREGFHTVTLQEAGARIGTLTTPWGSRADLVTASDAALQTWADTPIDATVDVSPPTHVIDGEAVGTVTWTSGTDSMSVDVVIDGDIMPPSALWRLTHPEQLGG